MSIITFSNPTTFVITRTEEKYHVHHGYRVAEAKCPARFAFFLFRVGAARCCLKIFFPIRYARLQFHYALSYYRTTSAKFFFLRFPVISFLFSPHFRRPAIYTRRRRSTTPWREGSRSFTRSSSTASSRTSKFGSPTSTSSSEW